MSAVVTCENLSVQHDDKLILQDINLSIAKHDYVCIVGPNGAGKSTLLKTLMGITPFSSGKLQLNQQPQQDFSQKQLAQHLSYVPQAHQQSLNFGVEEFIKMARYPFHSAFSEWQTEDQSAIDSAIEITNTDAFRHRQINTLSGGERQRVMIAAALAQQASILLLDEPTSFLDPHHQVEVHQLIQLLHQECKLTIIEVSHDINHASQHSQKVIALKNGQINWQGNANAFLNAQGLYDLYEQDFVFVEHPQTGKTIALASEQL